MLARDVMMDEVAFVTLDADVRDVGAPAYLGDGGRDCRGGCGAATNRHGDSQRYRAR